MKNEDFTVKYRPDEFKHVVGQDDIVSTLKKMSKNKVLPHVIILAGPPGVGKTTLAKIIGKAIECDESNILEVNSSDNTGVSDIRTLIKFLDFPALGKNSTKLIILDECQKISSSGWDALLKPFDKLPDHVYFVLCTTEFEKIPKTIRRRATNFILKEIDYNIILAQVNAIAKAENIELSSDSIKMICRAANGCLAEAIIHLGQCRFCTTKEEVAELINTYVDTKETYDLCKELVKNKPNFKKLQTILTDLKGKNPESIRQQIIGYLTTCVLTAKTENETLMFSQRLSYFSEPIYNSNAFYEIILNSMKALTE